MDGSRERLLNGNIPTRQRAQARKLVKKTIPLMSSYISKTPGNGKKYRYGRTESWEKNH